MTSRARIRIGRYLYRHSDGTLAIRVCGPCPTRGRRIDEEIRLPGATEAEAVALRDRAIEELTAGVYSREALLQSTRRYTLADFTLALIADRERVRARRTTEADRYFAAAWLEHPIAEIEIDRLDWETVRAWSEDQWRDDTVSRSTVWRRIKELQRTLTAAVDRGLRPDGSNPARALVLPLVPPPLRAAPPSTVQVAALFRHLRALDASALERTAAPTNRAQYRGWFPRFFLQWQWGRRGDEMLRLRWHPPTEEELRAAEAAGREELEELARCGFVDWESRAVVWPDSKTHAVIRLPLVPLHREHLERHRDNVRRGSTDAIASSPFVWPSVDGGRYLHTGSHGRAAWRAAREAAGIASDWRAHDLRSLAAVDLHDHSGERAARAVTGHRTASAFATYNRAREAELVRALEAQSELARQIGALDDTGDE